jgi:stage V sporulation protein S
MADTLIRVGSATPAAQLASAIANRIYEGHTVILQMIGAAAVSQAVKAIAVADGFTSKPPARISLNARAAFEDIPGGDRVITRILIRVTPGPPADWPPAPAAAAGMPAAAR